MKYQSSLKAKLIYVFRIIDKAHEGCLKIGEATLPESSSANLTPNCHELNQAAKARINSYTQTAGIAYDLLHTELTLFIAGGTIHTFNDKEVHDVLRRSGVKRHDFSTDRQGTEWYECDLATAINAIEAVKRGETALDGSKVSKDHNPIVFRPEQKDAITKTVRKFRTQGSHMLWNAKMRFGKTLTALEVVKECRFHRTLIITHRPVVDAGWFDDFGKIFYDLSQGDSKSAENYRYGSRNNGFVFDNLEADALNFPVWHYIYFASIQDLRGSEQVGGKFSKNEALLSAKWDCIIIDEAHEGTQTQLGHSVLDALQRNNPCVLNLSGTPFNLLDDFDEDEVYTWDYVMEQHAKQQWDLEHFGDPNPYAGLPRLNIFTFDLGKMVGEYADVVDHAFNFKEFFRTWTGNPGRDHVVMPTDALIGQFVHEPDVKRFLDLIVKYDPQSNYPYSTAEYRRNFRHSLWMLPGVKEARALSALLQKHPIFSQFAIVNVAGEGDEEADHDEALKMVEKAMGDDPGQTYSITLSCGRLTTGVTVRPWTAVFMLAGTFQTDAKAYMQTIFRVQSPYESLSGKRKEECFVFDFAPDRTLKVIAQAAKITAKAGKVQTDDDKATMGRFLNFCPIIGYNGTKMEPYNVEGMLEQLKKAYVDRVVRNGFEDVHLYNDNLLKLSEVELKKFEDLKAIIGATKANKGAADVDINKQGLTDEQYEQVEKAKKKPKRELTEEEKRLLEELKEKKKNRASAISILRGISIRFPLLIYGADLKNENEDVTIGNFANLIDDQSWEEFMPRGVTKEKFAEFVRYYDPDIFRASGRQIRDMARAADSLAPTERVRRIAAIFDCFRNPDKETVLTPWRVVNMHMSDTLGGWDFFDEQHTKPLGESDAPRFVDQGEVTQKVFFARDSRILEINSKTGLYPLYVAYSTFSARCKQYRDEHMLATDLPDDVQHKLWDEVLRDNIFVICKTPMAKSITRRTLCGFRPAKVNARYFEDLINQIQNKTVQFVDRVSSRNYWNASIQEKNMKFSAIVGNPPYQLIGGSGGTNDAPIFQHFAKFASIANHGYASLIIPSKWFTGGREGLLKDFRLKMLNCGNIKKLYAFSNSRRVFDSVEIKGGICYYLEDNNYSGPCEYRLINDNETISAVMMLNALDVLIRDPRLSSIVQKVKGIADMEGAHYVSDIVSSDTPFGIPTNPKENKKGTFEVLDEYNDDFAIQLHYLENNNRKIGFVRESEIHKNSQDISKYKVFVPKAGGTGNDAMVLGKPIVASKNSVCSQSFVYCSFGSETDAYNYVSYLKTKFFRALVSSVKVTQDAMSNVYRFVPLQDFSHPWTDAMLYEKYGLTQSEMDYIESLIKPME